MFDLLDLFRSDIVAQVVHRFLEWGLIGTENAKTSKLVNRSVVQVARLNAGP